MDRRRWISAIALVALLLGQTVPAQACRMLCGMKERTRVSSCNRCDEPGRSSPGSSLRAGTCCRMGPASTTEITPLVLTPHRGGAGSDEARLGASAAISSGPVGFPVAATRSSSNSVFESPPLVDLPTRTTVLRN